MSKRTQVTDSRTGGLSVVHEFVKRMIKGSTPVDNMKMSLDFIMQNDSGDDFPQDERIVLRMTVVESDVSEGTEDGYTEWRNIQAGSLGHADFRTFDTALTGAKEFRINSRNYVNTSGDATGITTKPRATATTTGEVRGIHAGPNISDGLGALTMTGVFSELYMRGTGAGTIDYTRAFYGKVLDDSDGSGSGTKTYTNPVAILWAEANIGSGNTFSGGLHVLNVEKGVYKDWDSFVRFSASGGAATTGAAGMFKDPLNDAEAGWINIYVGSTRYEVPFYASS